MTARFSTGLRNFIASGGGGYRDALQGGKIKIYTGSQPASADDAPTGTLLVTITDASGAHTSETIATGSVELTGGASGSVNTITVDGIEILGTAVNYATSLANTAALVAAQINANQANPEYTAAVLSGAIVTIYARRGTGAAANGLVVASTTTTLTKTDTNMSGGVTAVNGLKFGAASGGVLDKLSGQTWSGLTAVTGTAGWFRFEGPVADSGLLDSTASQIRLDGAISTSGQQLNMSSTSFTAGATQTISAFPITFPAA